MNENCILTDSELFRKPSEVLLKPTNFESLLTNQDVFTCLKKEFISDSLNSRDIKEKFGYKEISLEQILECLSNSSFQTNERPTKFNLIFP